MSLASMDRPTKSAVLLNTLASKAKPVLALHQCHDGLLVCGSDDGISFPMAHLLAPFNVAWPLADRAAVGDLPASVTPTQVAIAPRLLAAQMRV